ncbi:M-phase inducer phosphatase 1-like [Haliotis rubra]|uniref:M-phase inducer phosphatase 1-like n=1 Tax=Haliotis rubra TaxID=36100 RepID=UPI001EE59879|nr:M-phase inducer phosphatase 1-like [Haliotis rubra]
MAHISEADISFTDLKTLLFDSPCAWRNSDSESSDSGLGSPDSLSECSSDGSPVSLCGSLARRSLFPSKRQREDLDDQEDSPIKRSRQELISLDWDSDEEEERTRSAVEKLQAADQNLIGDGTRVHTLPTVETRNHRDLKTVTPSTVQLLMKGRFPEISEYQIVDCRYPYEFEGGHIQGAANIYTEKGISELIKRPASQPTVLIFHCEFSSERGPKM